MSRESANRNRIFIGRLNPEARVKDVEAFFKDNGFARLKDVNVKLGYAFVEFDDKRDADDAVYELDRKEFFGSRIVVELAKRGPRIHDDRERDGYRDGRAARGRPYNTEWRVIVTNLSSRVGWMDLKDYFRAAGEVTFTKANKERMGEGVVEFKSYREMKRAVKRFDGTEFFDRRIKCIDDSPGPPRDYSGSRSRSRSNHRSRSRSRSRRRSRSRSRSPRRSRSRSRSKSRTPRSKSRSPRRSRSKSPQKSRSRTPPPQEEDKAAE